MMGGQTHKQFTYTCIQYCAPHLRLQEMKNIYSLLAINCILPRCRFVKAAIHTLLQDLPTNEYKRECRPGQWEIIKFFNLYKYFGK